MLKDSLSGLRWQMKTFYNDEKCFLFHVKSSSRSWDINIFVMVFLLCRKSASES